jgi:hypothetical protein
MTFFVAVIILLEFAVLTASINNNNLFGIRGGWVPQASEAGGDYFEKFEIDYGCQDNVRIAGSTRGLIKAGKLSSLPESDPFLKWVNEHLEKGQEEPNGRLKPFYVLYCLFKVLLLLLI